MNRPYHIGLTADRAASSPRASDREWSTGDPLDVLIEHLRAHPRVDAAVFLVADEAGEGMEVATSWFGSPLLEEALETVLGGRHDGGSPGLAEAAMERDRPLVVASIEAWESAPALKGRIEEQLDPVRARRAWDALRSASVIGCPVHTGLGQLTGVLVVASVDPTHALHRADVETVKVMADLAALARERSHLVAVEGRRARDELLLKRAAEETSGSLEIRDVEIQTVEHSLRVVEADHASLTRVGERSSRLATTAGTGTELAPEHAALDAGVLAEVVRSQQTVRLESAPFTLHVPVQLGRRLFGVLSVLRVAGPAFGAREVELVEAVTRISAAAIANALDFDRERRLAQTLTRGFVPASPPNVPGFDMGFLYEPAESQVAGGDLYGSWRLPSGEVAVLVGDVAGKGVATSALSAMARFFVEARSWDSEDPAETLAQTSTMLCDRLPGDTFVTASFGFLARGGCLRYANAGHLRPLVLRAGGELGEAGGAGLPLGIEPSPQYENYELQLGPGDLVLGFTDGLVEARRGIELLGDERLQAIVRAAAGEADHPRKVVRLIHSAVRDWAGGLSDDVVLFALKRHAGPSS